MFAKIFAVLFVTSFLVTTVHLSNLDIGNACIAQYLKDKGHLEEDFPVSAVSATPQCRLVMPIVIKAFEAALCSKLRENESIKADCVMKEIKAANAMEFMLMQEIIVMTKDLEEEKMKKKLEVVKENLRTVFENAAKTCDSDPTYAGQFNDILEIKNESLAVLRQNYCFTKFAIESKLLDVKDIDINPKKIVTTDIDCKAMIMKNRLQRENKLMESLKTRQLSKEQSQCIKDKFQIERAFDSNLALEVIDHIDVTLEVRKRNRENIAKRLESFILSIFLCVGNASSNHQTSATDMVSIIQS